MTSFQVRETHLHLQTRIPCITSLRSRVYPHLLAFNDSSAMVDWKRKFLVHCGKVRYMHIYRKPTKRDFFRGGRGWGGGGESDEDDGVDDSLKQHLRFEKWATKFYSKFEIVSSLSVIKVSFCCRNSPIQFHFEKAMGTGE